MRKDNKNQHGFAALAVVLAVALIAVVVGALFFVKNKQNVNDPEEKTGQQQTTQTVPSQSSNKTGEAKIKHIGVELDYYNKATNKAGDFLFTKEKLSFDRLFFDFGFEVPANSAGPAKKNPQPTFIVPLGTKVHALVDGTVNDVPKLYSNDYSVMIQGEGSQLIFETEHVINVTVKKGDVVKAGDVIAEVSDYDAKNYAGLGLVEIGILKGGGSGPPQHLCPFDYLDDSIKEDTLKKNNCPTKVLGRIPRRQYNIRRIKGGDSRLPNEYTNRRVSIAVHFLS